MKKLKSDVGLEDLKTNEVRMMVLGSESWDFQIRPMYRLARPWNVC